MIYPRVAIIATVLTVIGAVITASGAFTYVMFLFSDYDKKFFLIEQRHNASLEKDYEQDALLKVIQAECVKKST